MGGERLEKLVPLIPSVVANLTHFQGVFAPTSRLRAQVVPMPPGRDHNTASRPADGVAGRGPGDAVAVKHAPVPSHGQMSSAARPSWHGVTPRILTIETRVQTIVPCIAGP